MEIKSYYFKLNKIFVRDFSNNQTVLELNRTNLSKMISSMNKQITTNVATLIEEEDKIYKNYINALSLITLFELFTAYMIFYGFISANYYSMILGILLSGLLVGYTMFISFKNIKALRKVRTDYKMYEGREILIDKYKSLNKVSETSLVDVY